MMRACSLFLICSISSAAASERLPQIPVPPLIMKVTRTWPAAAPAHPLCSMAFNMRGQSYSDASCLSTESASRTYVTDRSFREGMFSSKLVKHSRRSLPARSSCQLATCSSSRRVRWQTSRKDSVSGRRRSPQLRVAKRRSSKANRRIWRGITSAA